MDTYLECPSSSVQENNVVGIGGVGHMNVASSLGHLSIICGSFLQSGRVPEDWRTLSGEVYAQLEGFE